MYLFFDLLNILFIPLDYLSLFLEKRARIRRQLIYRKANCIHPTVSLGRSELDSGYIEIGEGTYLIRAIILSASEGRVKIGKYCAIGRNVSIKARTHDLDGTTSTPLRKGNLRKYGNITIGNYVWIGDNAFIREGVSIGDHAVIGANSVVTHDVAPYTVVGGVPAKVLKTLQPSE